MYFIPIVDTNFNNEARERLTRISIVKAEKAQTVEDLLIRIAQSGKLRGIAIDRPTAKAREK
ncbi:2304_t:CDS:2, partial [Dentiscutata heterogama]